MNRAFKIVWNRVMGAWVIVSELAKTKAKGGRQKRASHSPFLGLCLATLVCIVSAENEASAAICYWYHGWVCSDDQPQPEDVTGLKYVQINSTGEESKASGTDSSAMGPAAAAYGDNAMALGKLAKATGVNSTAVGVAAKAGGHSALALGSESNASGIASSALGYQANASGYTATALGFNTKASGQSSVA
ncbi:ESPR-type extended signal peptide-containing protein, partial [Xanthomonas albilineans]|uniref:ESPR-type extended signal peptide-containing protein n=1 Tax=Xanthomonas albilineans TaxID=29447 RepID=UPI0005F34708